ncbi:sensor histidine kinase [Haloarchaeobius amylolyticus]|uniref:sensor histidine kinase n=1 Tax=Haloarchaeobius amylolyticus TaxID=1198296 RepID=UPI00226FE8B0|nr:ATP-binding protein [Haloarchaeobius amylolyticus]
MTAAERETLRVALSKGYFEVPRQTPLVDIAEELGRSDVETSRHIQRGMGTVLRATNALEGSASGADCPSESAVGSVEEATDATERERQLQRRVEQLDRFASVLSHDLRNPLNTAKMSLELAREDPESVESHHERIEQSLDRIDELVTSLLLLAREGQVVSDFETVSLTETAARAWEFIEEPDATLRFEMDEATVRADPERLHTIFENLFQNAVTHGGPGVTIRVGLVNGGFFVKDDGPGIPSAEREEVFEYGHTTSSDGNGFGLSIVESIAIAHGWEVTVTESWKGGARIEFTTRTAPQ